MRVPSLWQYYFGGCGLKSLGTSVLDFVALVFLCLLSLTLLYLVPLFKLYNYFEDSNYVYLVLEMCHNGEMSRYLKERKMPFSEDEGQAEQFSSENQI